MALGHDDAVQLKFERARNTALSIEVARLKDWRFGKSSESMDAHQGEFFDAKTLVALKEESQAEDRAQDEARSSKTTKRQAKRQALPSQLERIEHHYEIEPAQCDQGQFLQSL